jgi:hypothetical protein
MPFLYWIGSGIIGSLMWWGALNVSPVYKTDKPRQFTAGSLLMGMTFGPLTLATGVPMMAIAVLGYSVEEASKDCLLNCEE